jgi:tetratricopeptide (TPR) repeat protein
METKQMKNLVILVVVLVLVAGGIYYYKKSREKIPNSPFEEYPQGEVDNSSTPTSELVTPQEGNQEKLTYDQYLQQGINYETKGELLKAISSYRKASELAPKEYVPYSNAGSAYYSMQKYTEAEDHFLQALELVPNNVSVYTKLYEVYFYGLKRNPEQMTTFFQDAMKNTNNSVNIVTLYASYLEQINDPESALPIWQSLLQVEPDNAAYKAKVEALQKKING